ncbi:MAG: DUF1573 domain-containing protein [Bacteroidetes bacterium]|nr:DUF1573 domain-containing protein [Bacteroidota bacterium]
MKKIFFYVSALSLVACNETTPGESAEVNTGEQSSVIETTNPQTTNSSTSNNPGTTEAAEGDITTIEYIETKHNFGNVFYPSENKYTFKFKNTGSTPLIIEEATASCGCTIPNKPEEPIMPGEIGELDVIFRPKEGQVGQTVTKTITVVANTSPAESFLEISANVMESL